MKTNVAQQLRAFAGMESADSEPVTLTKEQLEDLVEDLVEDIAEQKIEEEMKEISEEIEDLQDEIEEQQEELAELAEVVEGMEYLIQQPNANSTALALLYQRAERLHVSLGGTSTLPRAGVESLNPRTIEAHAIVGVESFTDTLKAGVDAGKEMIRRLIEWMKTMWNEWFAGKKQLLSRRDKLLKRLLDSDLKDQIKVGPWGAYFSVYGNYEVSENDSYFKLLDLLNSLQVQLCGIINYINKPQELIQICNDIRGRITEFYSRYVGKKKVGEIASFTTPGIMGVRFYDGKIASMDDVSTFLSSLRFLVETPLNAPAQGTVERRYERDSLVRYLDQIVPGLINTVEKGRDLIKSIESTKRVVEKVNLTSEQQRFVSASCKAATSLTNSVMQSNLRLIKADMAMVEAHIK